MNAIITGDIDWLIQHTDWKLFRDKKILITGASGSIAQYLAFYFMMLNEEKQSRSDVYALVRNEEKARRIFADYMNHSCFHLIVGDVERGADSAEGMNYIFHAAGISATRLFATNPVEVMSVNIIGTYNLLAAAARRKEIEKFVFFSSGAVYGQVPDSLLNIAEDTFFAMDALNDSGVYAESKRAGELLCYSYWKEFQVPSVMARIGHTYGPGIDINDGHVYSDMVKSVLKRQPIMIRNPEEKRPFTYVRDTVWGILLMTLSGGKGEAYNVWNARQRISIGELAHILTKKVFKDRNLEVYCKGKIYNYSGQNAKDLPIRRADTHKLETIGWKASVDVGEGFYRTVESIESNSLGD